MRNEDSSLSQVLGLTWAAILYMKDPSEVQPLGVQFEVWCYQEHRSVPATLIPNYIEVHRKKM